MKFLMFTLAFFGATAFANAQATSAGDSMETQIARQLAKQPAEEHQITVQPAKPNEVKVGSVTCSGIAVQVATTDNPLQLVNPAAPDRYGSPEQNVARDPINGKVTGLKLFAVNF